MNDMKTRLNELNEKYEIDPEVLKAVLAFLDCGDQHAMKVLFGIKTDEDLNCTLEEPINWDVRTASHMKINDMGDSFIAYLGHLYFTLKGERRVSLSIQLTLQTYTYRPDDLSIESWPYGELSGCTKANQYFKVNEKTKTDVFDFLKELETHECHEYCNSEKFPDEEE